MRSMEPPDAVPGTRVTAALAAVTRSLADRSRLTALFTNCQAENTSPRRTRSKRRSTEACGGYASYGAAGRRATRMRAPSVNLPRRAGRPESPATCRGEVTARSATASVSPVLIVVTSKARAWSKVDGPRSDFELDADFDDAIGRDLEEVRGAPRV